MRKKLYPYTIAFIQKVLKKKFPKIKPKEDLKNPPANLLWMMKKIEKFTDTKKAARWIGWVTAHAEILGLLTNAKTRELIRKDRDAGFE